MTSETLFPIQPSAAPPLESARRELNRLVAKLEKLKADNPGAHWSEIQGYEELHFAVRSAERAVTRLEGEMREGRG